MQPSLSCTDLQFWVPSQKGGDTFVTFGAVTGFGIHYPIHHPAGVEHVHHKHPHDQGGEGRFQEHGASLASLCRLLLLAEALARRLSANE